ncbi:MFS transporter [Bradyrhizobium sp. MOS003]|uniref:MFS transporter n=1 Tax=Bradyrhizobium sp. MOS003 TaxID=2133946 RepID=UPI000D12CEF8|nr:MFS transporter [Bradyrhizobium sp. MOS003]PSO16618.1 MFS transporter [Bradyrhizobium sp. MOS003]
MVRPVHAPNHSEQTPETFSPDSRQAWIRLVLALLIGSIGGVGMWAIVVMIPAVQTEFSATRGAVSLAFTLMMFGFGLGGVIAGKITDRFGIVPAMAISIAFLGVANVFAGLSTQLWQFVAAYFLIGLGTSATFAPLMAEASHWFERYRGLAVTIVASGNYFAGTMWPPIVNWGMQEVGWRHTHIGIGLVCVVLMTILVLVLRAQIGHDKVHDHANAPPPRVDLKLSTNTLTVLLSIASISCCVAMAMPQVHIVAYCGDLGYGVARGAEMLSLMMACGIVSRIGSGFLADKIGGIPTLLIGALAQGFALVFYLFFDSLASLYLISAMFGLFQGGIVPSYAIIVREAMPAREAATRVGIVIFASVFGMSFGGWVSGVIFDATGSYAAAFANGVAWNAVNISIVVTLLIRSRMSAAKAGPGFAT